MAFISGSELVIPSSTFPGHFVKDPSEATVKHWALKIMKEKSSEAFVLMEKLFQDPQNYSKKLFDGLRKKQIDPMVSLAMIVDIGLTEVEYSKIKKILDMNDAPVLYCWKTVMNEVDK